MALRIANQYLYDDVIGNIQASYRELARLQNQLSTQKLFAKPSEAPITANQAIRLERNLSEIKQYAKNVASGTDLLTYSDQIAGQIRALVSEAAAKSAQGLNVTTEDDGRVAIASELQGIMDSVLSLGNSTMAGRAVFGGTNYTAAPFEYLGDDVIFGGNNEAFNVNVFASETVQASMSADGVFGALQTVLGPEKDLNPRLSPLSLSTSVKAGTLVLSEGYDQDTASLSVTVAEGATIDTVITAINTAARTKATTAQADAAAAAVAAYQAIGGNLTIGAVTLAAADFTAAYAALASANSVSVKTATRTLLENTYNGQTQPITAEVEQQIAAAERAARNTFSASEFSAVLSRGGLQVLHGSGRRLGVNEGSSTAATLHDLELAGRLSGETFQYQGTLSAAVAADQTLTLTGKGGATMSATIRAGDSLSVIARRINQAANSTGVNSAFYQLVASVSSDPSDGVAKLKISCDKGFAVSGVTELTAAGATARTSLSAFHDRVDDLRDGAGLKTGSVRLEGSNTSGFGSDISIRAGDSVYFLLRQLNDLAGFEADLNSAGTGIDLRSVARYCTTVTPVAPTTLTLSAYNSSATATVNLAALTTMSERAEAINAASTSAFRFHAEVDSTGTKITVSSNVQFTMDDAGDNSMDTTISSLTDLTSSTLTSSTMLDSIGLSGTMASDGLVSGRYILARQARLSDLNNGDGVSLGRIRITVGGSSSADISLASAVTLRDVKDLIEAALPGQVTVDLNSAANGLKVSSTSASVSIRIEELDGGAVGRHLGLIPAPQNSSSGVYIEGSDLNLRVTSQTLLKDLDGGGGMSLGGMTIKNGSRQSVVSFDSDGDGIDDIRTVQDLVEHINRRSREDLLQVTADFDRENGGIRIASRLSSAALEIKEQADDHRYFRVNGIVAGAVAETLNIQGTATPSVNVTMAIGDSLATVVDKINAAARSAAFSFTAKINTAGTGVMIEAPKSISVLNTTTPATAYTTEQVTPFPYGQPDYGGTASDLGLLGSFSDTTPLSTLNAGAGINNGQFTLTYGSKLSTVYKMDHVVVPAAAQTLTIYDENAAKSFNVALAVADTVYNIRDNIIAAAQAAGFTTVSASVEDSATNVVISSTGKKITAKNSDTAVTYKTVVDNANALDPANSTTVTVDLEAATTLGDVKRAIEDATDNAVLVRYGQGNRLELVLASNDMAKGIRINEISDSSDTAGSLGLIGFADLVGREIGDGEGRLLTNATLLSDIGLSWNAAAAANSTENSLVLMDGFEPVTINLSQTTTVGDVISAINAKTVSDNGAAVNFDAEIVAGRYIRIRTRSSLPLSALQSDFSKAAQKLGLVPDATRSQNVYLAGSGLDPSHRADNFFSALLTVITNFRTGQANQPEVSKALSTLERMESLYLETRAEAGGRINRFDALKARFEDEQTFLDTALGQKTDIDIIEVTQKYLAQQQTYEAGLSSVSRIVGLSLFDYL